MYSKNVSATNSIITRQFFLDIGSLEVMHELILTIPSVIQISSIQLRFSLGKPRIACNSIF